MLHALRLDGRQLPCERRAHHQQPLADEDAVRRLESALDDADEFEARMRRERAAGAVAAR